MKKQQLRVVLFIGMLLISSLSFAQANKEVFEKKLSLSSSTLRIDTLVKQLTRQTGIEFSFNAGKIHPSQIIRLASKNETLRGILNTFQNNFGIGHKLVGNHIILTTPGTVPDRTKTSFVVTRNATAKSDARANAPKSITRTNTSSLQSAQNTGSTHALFTKSVFLPKDSLTLKTEPPAVPQLRISSTDTSQKNEVPPAGKKAASTKSSSLLNNLNLDIGLQGIGISYQSMYSKKSAIDISAGIGGGYFITGKQFSYVFRPSNPALYTAVQTKFFYSGDLNKGGSYFGIELKLCRSNLFGNNDSLHAQKWLAFKGYESTFPLLFNVHWGIQKPLSERWTMDAHIGPGYSFDLKHPQNHWYPSVGLKFSYHFKNPAKQ